MGTAALRKSSLDRVVYSSSSFRQRPCAFTTRHRVAGDKTCSDLKNSTTFVLLRTGQCLKRQPRCRRLSMPVTVIRFSRPDRLIAPPDPRAYRPLAIELPQNGLVFRVFQPVVVRAAVNASLFCGFGGLAGHRKKLQESRFFLAWNSVLAFHGTTVPGGHAISWSFCRGGKRPSACFRRWLCGLCVSPGAYSVF